jgi:putative FmdB family regulatory protein
MPIYEYRCKRCNREFSALIMGSGDESKIRCKMCTSADLTRLHSRFSYHQSEESRVEAFSTKRPRDDTSCKDSRNIGLWAKKRARELGVDLGGKFDEVVEKARTGRILEDYEK